MPSPIRDRWWNRPGWGEYLALRGGKPTHGGFDSYTTPLANVYGTANNGTVLAAGYVEGGWGNYIDVYYPSQNGNPAYTQRDCHLNERADYVAVGGEVNTTTRLGRVGRTGNAKNIFWPANQSPNGKELWHVHSEVYLGVRGINFSRRTNPLPVWGATTAGGGGNAINERRNTMSTIFKHSGQSLWALAGDSPGTTANWQEVADTGFVRDLEAVHGPAVTVSAGVWQNRKSWYTEPLATNVGIDTSALAEALAHALSGLIGGTPLDPAVLASAVADELADEFASIPTATDNGQAARDAIVRD